MARQLQQLQPSNQLLLSHIHSNHDQKVESKWRPEPQASQAQCNEAAPVQQRGGFDQGHSQLRLTWRNSCDAVSVEASGLGGVEVMKTNFLLSPTISAPGLQIRGRGRQQGHRVTADMEVDLTGEKPQDEVALGLRDVLWICYCNIMDGIQIIS